MASPSLQACIDACNACAAACHHCAVACLREDDVKTMARCVALDMDCAAACQLTAAAAARGSELTGAIAAEVVAAAEHAMRTEDKVRAAILSGVDPRQAYLEHGKF